MALSHHKKIKTMQEAVTDWRGNVVKVGDEICLIQTKTNNVFRKLGIIVPHEDGSFTEHYIKDPEEEDCWIVGEYVKVEEGLVYTVNDGVNTLTQSIIILSWFCTPTRLLAIKGVSDKKN